MKTSVTSKEAILEVSRRLIQEQGWSSVNIRAVAAAGKISVGSVYNYFASKSELVAATIESIWFDIFHSQGKLEAFADFPSCIAWLYDCLRRGGEKYPGFYDLHAMSFTHTAREEGKQLMAQSWRHMQQQLLKALQADPNVRQGVFDDVFTAEKLVEQLFSILFFSLLRGEYDAAAVITMVQKLLY